jgi:competence protein ComEC
LKAWGLLIGGAVSPYLFTATISSPVAVACLIIIALTLARFWSTRIATCPVRVLCLCPVCFMLTTLAINQRLETRLPESENLSVHVVSGTIGSLPRSGANTLRFLFLNEAPTASVPARIRVHWYIGRAGNGSVKIPQLRAGERWRLHLQLRTTRARVNFNGTDNERWMFSEGVAALGYVQAGENVKLAGAGMFDLHHLRQNVLERLTQSAGEVPAFHMLAALAVADRRGFGERERTLLSATGTGHLVAISGLHIGLAAALGFYCGKLLLLFLPCGLQHRVATTLPWLLAWLASLGYAALSGFGISTQRALIMLSVGTVVLLSRRTVHPSVSWLIAMAAVLMLDPFAPLRAGFWFSFAAVAVLLMLLVPRHGQLSGWRLVLTVQAGISITLAPLGVYWFQQASLPGLLANLVAIPVVSFLIVPLVLIAMLFLFLPGPLATWLLTLAGYTSHWLLMTLEYFALLQPPGLSTTQTPGLMSTLLAILGAVVLLLPRGLPHRYLGVLMMMPLVIPSGSSPGDDGTQADILDVGQGLAVLVASREYLMVYDTGPGNGLAGEHGWDMVDGTIRPVITAAGRTPDLVVVSHADLDHAGGLARMHELFPEARFLASLPVDRSRVERCRSAHQWLGGELRFKVLHPSPGLPYLGNNSSCVISVTGNGLNLLLSGDISQVVEQRLVQQGLKQHQFLTAPHHGSSTSSSASFINTLQPSLVLVSAGANNRFGFPRSDVMHRYAQANVRTLNTAQCGGIRIITSEHAAARVITARRFFKTIWRWPPPDNCP